jgi:fucose permease
MVSIAFVFAIRGDIMPELGTHFHLTKEEVGWVAGAAFWGYPVAILIGGQLCDVLGMGRLLGFSFLAYVAGTALTIWAPGFWMLWTGSLCTGIANGCIEAAVNPLIATLYPRERTQKLNIVHAWFPAGIAVSGLAVYGLTKLGVHWQVKMLLVLLPAITYGVLLLGQKFPATERVQLGFSNAGMYRETMRPMFVLLVGCMFLTAATELGPNQWIPDILTATAGLQGILVLVWINGVMAFGRLGVGTIMRRLSPIGLLMFAAIFASAGLFWLSTAASPQAALASATVFAFGICYFWPTMLGMTSETFPAGGALLMAIIAGAGNLSVAIVLPLMGRIYDAKGPRMAFRCVSALPVILILVFGTIWLRDRARRDA